MEAFSTAWEAAHAHGGLRPAPCVTLPTDGPIHQLLQATRQVVAACTSPDQDVKALLAEVMEAGLLGPLLQLFDWLQQQPCTALHSAEPDKLSSLHWYLLMNALTALVGHGNDCHCRDDLGNLIGMWLLHGASEW